MSVNFAAYTFYGRTVHTKDSFNDISTSTLFYHLKKKEFYDIFLCLFVFLSKFKFTFMC